jgi:hypothetical protein
MSWTNRSIRVDSTWDGPSTRCSISLTKWRKRTNVSRYIGNPSKLRQRSWARTNPIYQTPDTLGCIFALNSEILVKDDQSKKGSPGRCHSFTASFKLHHHHHHHRHHSPPPLNPTITQNIPHHFVCHVLNCCYSSTCCRASHTSQLQKSSMKRAGSSSAMTVMARSLGWAMFRSPPARTPTLALVPWCIPLVGL